METACRLYADRLLPVKETSLSDHSGATLTSPNLEPRPLWQLHPPYSQSDQVSLWVQLQVSFSRISDILTLKIISSWCNIKNNSLRWVPLRSDKGNPGLLYPLSSSMEKSGVTSSSCVSGLPRSPGYTTGPQAFCYAKSWQVMASRLGLRFRFFPSSAPPAAHTTPAY